MSLFFVQLEAVEYTRIYAKVLISDTTYNTNSTKMPLFKVIGINTTRSSFCVSFEFMCNKTKPSIKVALSYIREVLRDKATKGGVILTDKDATIRNIVAKVLPK